MNESESEMENELFGKQNELSEEEAKEESESRAEIKELHNMYDSDPMESQESEENEKYSDDESLQEDCISEYSANGNTSCDNVDTASEEKEESIDIEFSSDDDVEMEQTSDASNISNLIASETSSNESFISDSSYNPNEDSNEDSSAITSDEDGSRIDFANRYGLQSADSESDNSESDAHCEIEKLKQRIEQLEQENQRLKEIIELNML